MRSGGEVREGRGNFRQETEVDRWQTQEEETGAFSEKGFLGMRKEGRGE